MVLWMSKHLPPFNLVHVKHSGRTTDVNFINGMPVLSMYTQSCTSPWTFQMADFELFNTVYNVITFVSIFGGILIIALAKHWFDVSGWLSFHLLDTTWAVIFFFFCLTKIVYIFAKAWCQYI